MAQKWRDRRVNIGRWAGLSEVQGVVGEAGDEGEMLLRARKAVGGRSV